MPPPVEDISDEESGDIPFRDAPEDQAEDKAADDQAEEDEDDDEEEEGVYIVEEIVQHDWLDDGTLKLLVKWKGYEDPTDRTWEEEEGLKEGAGDILAAYYKKVGGRPELPPPKAKPGRKRKSMADSKSATPTASSSAAEPKRRKSHKETKKVESDADENITDWVPKGKSWDKEVQEVDTIVRDPENNGLYAWLVFNNGRKSRVTIEACYEKCPMKMLKFYESHLVFKDG
ncbi:hypothetical protein N7499_011785 [Penicillium canescens]|uniref:Chromo domain-containing protein n=1 Tax=Penicillium canescens TaxID=5083 RepID=A0AAD6IKP4_PENCN|nr:uncharacterized protein N7446_007047 [Penicillium canescens]KAJ6012545.1 hypothetical protein N7522_002900 [Penicillium canescens]KAJ6049628.1 hypothetical protein N7444_006344 [Penicillium canescens]KAJ6052404.1 hypothetical protein N7460_002938 [Penicillium canescens]KAJ6062927.1 hypothetical protein N7446_007047 [Penicillium canescens]KAJ6069898.1 hypothetical protein N7499_011785 [Penicillium canescens]